MSKYQEMAAKVEKFAEARTKYWDDLNAVLGEFLPKYREYLGLKDVGWEGPSGTIYPYFSIGRDEGGKFVQSRIFELNSNDYYQLEFVLLGNLQAGESIHAFEPVFLEMTLERKGRVYVFVIKGFNGRDTVSYALTEHQYANGDWSKLFDDVTTRIESEFELRQFA